MKKLIVQAGIAALEGNVEQFKHLLAGCVDTDSRGLWLASIISPNPKETMEALIEIRGEPSVGELKSWFEEADKLKHPQAMAAIADRLVVKNPQDLKRLGELIRVHDNKVAHEWTFAAMKNKLGIKPRAPSS